MSKGRKKKQIAVRTEISPDPISPQSCVAAEEFIAELLARAYIADHPELFEATGKGLRIASASLPSTPQGSGCSSPGRLRGEPIR